MHAHGRSVVAFSMWLGCASAVIALHTPPLQDAQRPPFRSGVELVEVDVVAVDDAGRPVVDLSRDEFKIYEDGKQQDLVWFTHVNLPVPEPHSPWLPDVSTNARAADGRVFFLVLDDANSARSATEPIRSTVRQLLSRMGPQDRVGMLWVSLRNEGAWEFTTDHGAILQAVDLFEGDITTIERRNPVPFISPLDRPMPGARGGEADPIIRRSGPPDLKRFFDPLRPFKIVRDVSHYVAGLPSRRKAVIYIGQAMRPLGPKALRTGNREYADIELQRTLTEARRANVAVYLLDPVNPYRPGVEDLFEETSAEPLERLRSGNLAALARVTGGVAAASPLTSVQVDRIMADTSSYYLLSYYADPPQTGGVLSRLKALANAWEGFRRIEVRTTRPGITLRARSGYWPERPSGQVIGDDAKDARDALLATTGGVLPKTDLALRAFAAPFRGTNRRPSVMVAVEVQDEGFRVDPLTGFQDTVEVVVVAIEMGREIRLTKRLRLKIALPSEKADAMKTHRYLLCSDLELRPGQYQLRIGVRSAVSGKTGSVYYDLLVPDFADGPVVLSGVVIGESTGALPMPVANTKSVTRFAPFVPSLSREFAPDHEVSVFARIYRTSKAGDPEVRVVGQVDSVETSSTAWRSSSVVSFGTDDQAECRLELPLEKLKPGRYTLTVEAQDARGHELDARKLDFLVRQP